VQTFSICQLDGVVNSDAAKRKAVAIVLSSDPDLKIGSNIIL
jgi:hypothetical protein